MQPPRDFDGTWIAHLQTMQIKEIMTSNVETIRPESTLIEAAEKMRNLNIGALPVANGEDVVGILTDRDIITKAIAVNEDPQTTHVDQIMTTDIQYCYEDQDIDEAMELMKDKQIRRLIVKDRQEHLVGIASLGDIAIEHDDDGETAETLEKISEPSKLDN